MKKRSLFLLLLGALSLASCGKESVPIGGTVESVAISQSSIDVQLGKRSSDVTVSLEGVGEYNKNVKLVSEDESIAKTSFTEVESGKSFKVYGIAAGTTKINVVSVQDETKATSLSVSVKAKEEIPEPHEILSVSLDRETKLFHLSDEAISVKVHINGRGPYDKTATVLCGINPCVTVDKTSVSDGETILVAPKALSVGEEKTIIKVISNEDNEKYAELAVRVIEDEVIPQIDVISLNCAARTLQEGGKSFEVIATTEGEITWSFKEADASQYVEIESSSNEGAIIKPLKATPDGTVATLVATVGTATAECRFTVAGKEKEVRTYYVSNNSYLGYEQVYFYTWKGDGEDKVENAPFPGIQLTEKIQNTLGEDCYLFSVDILEFEQFIISDGSMSQDKQTPDSSFEWFGSNNNVWYDTEGAHFTQIAKDEPTVSFFKNSVSIYTGEAALEFGFEVRKGTAEYEVTSGGNKINVTSFSNGTIAVEGLATGNATIRVFIPDTEAEDFLFIEILDESMAKSFYFTNNKGWSKLYAHMWKDGDADKTATNWPGIELTNPLKNTGGEDVYLVHVPTKYDRFVINNGIDASEGKYQTVDVSLDNEAFKSKDNIYLEGDASAEGKYEIGFATFEEMAYTVSFAEASVTVYKDKLTRVSVNASTSGVTYNVSEGSDAVQLYEATDNHIILKFLKAGSAKVKATLHGVSAELSVTCLDEEAPAVTEFLYFTNNFGWEEVYLYAWGDKGTTMKWPGEKLTEKVKNADNQDCYKLLFDNALYDKFIVNNGAGAQTVDVSMGLAEWATNNNIYIPGSLDDAGHYYVGFANYHASHSYDPETHLCECGKVDPEWLVEVTFTCEYDTKNDGDLYIVLINEDDSQTWMKMTCYDKVYWSLTTQMIKGTHIKFKVVVGRSGGDIWEGGSDREWTIPNEPTTYECHWQN